jgi:hypothetical protein
MENILNNEELMQKFANAKNVDELAAVLAENNIALGDDLTAEKLFEIINNPPAESDELDADALEDVSGGAVVIMGPVIGYGVARAVAKLIKRLRR